MATLRQAQAAATRQRLLETAAERFAADGFEAVTAAKLCEAAGVTRGALYHHFSGLPEVMETVFAEAEGRLVDETVTRLGSFHDPSARLVEVGPTVLEILGDDDGMRRIVFVEAPTALGWSRWRALDEGRSLTLVAGLVAEAGEADRLRAGVVAPVAAQLLLGAINEAAMRVAAVDRPGVIGETAEHLRLLAAGLLSGR